MLTLPVVLSVLGLILAYSTFQFGLFRWLISRIDLLGVNFKAELSAHQAADLEALKEVRSELRALKAPRKQRSISRRSR